MAARKQAPPNPVQVAYDARVEDLAARRRTILAQFTGPAAPVLENYALTPDETTAAAGGSGPVGEPEPEAPDG